MVKKKKVVLAITIPIATILAAIICFISVFGIIIITDHVKDSIAHRNWTAIDYCNSNWDVQIPKTTIEYHFSDCGGWLGDGEKYTICQYSSRPDEFLKEFSVDLKGENVEKYNKVLNLLQSSDVDKSKLFEPTANFIWWNKTMNGNCTLLLAYNEKTNKLYIIEDFM